MHNYNNHNFSIACILVAVLETQKEILTWLWQGAKLIKIRGQENRSAPNPVLFIQCSFCENTNETLYGGPWKELYWSLLEAFRVYKYLQVFSHSVLYWCRNHSYIQTGKGFCYWWGIEVAGKIRTVLSKCLLILHFVCKLLLVPMFSYQPKHENISTPQKQTFGNVLSATCFVVVNELWDVQQHHWLQPEFWTQIGPG